MKSLPALATLLILASAARLVAQPAPRATSAAPAQPPPIVFAPPSAAPARVETARDRLLALQFFLQQTLAALPQAESPLTGSLPDNGTRERINAQLKLALADVAAGLAYVQAHPASGLLPDRPEPVALPGLFRLYLGITPQTKQRFPTMTGASDYFLTGLSLFLTGTDTSASPSTATFRDSGRLVGELGGFRDKILRSVYQAQVALDRFILAIAGQPNRGVAEFFQPSGFVPLAERPSAPTTNIPKPGTISGFVVDASGDPAANVLVSFSSRVSEAELRAAAIVRYTPSPPGSPPARGFQSSVDSMTHEQRQAAIETAAKAVSYGIQIPATISDDQGRFTVGDLPPGDYRVSGSLAGISRGWRLSGSTPPLPPIVVKSGQETKLAEPLKLE